MKDYRGDTLWRTYKVKYQNSPYTFVAGDKIKVAFINNDIKYLEKEIVLDNNADSITVEWTANDMKTLKSNREYVLEAEITTATFVKTYQENIIINKDYIV